MQGATVGVAQLAERRTVDAVVVGSSPITHPEKQFQRPALWLGVRLVRTDPFYCATQL